MSEKKMEIDAGSIGVTEAMKAVLSSDDEPTGIKPLPDDPVQAELEIQRDLSQGALAAEAMRDLLRLEGHIGKDQELSTDQVISCLQRPWLVKSAVEDYLEKMAADGLCDRSMGASSLSPDDKNDSFLVQITLPESLRGSAKAMTALAATKVQPPKGLTLPKMDEPEAWDQHWMAALMRLASEAGLEMADRELSALAGLERGTSFEVDPTPDALLADLLEVPRVAQVRLLTKRLLQKKVRPSELEEYLNLADLLPEPMPQKELEALISERTWADMLMAILWE